MPVPKDLHSEEFALYGFSNRKEPARAKDQVDHFNDLFESIKLRDSDRTRIVSIMGDLFPAIKTRLEGKTEPIDNPYSKKQRRERRIGVNLFYLDRYFSLNDEVDQRHAIEDSLNSVLSDDYFQLADSRERITLLETIMPQSNDKTLEQIFYESFFDILSDIEDDSEKTKLLSQDILRLLFQGSNFATRHRGQLLYGTLDAIDLYAKPESYQYIFSDLENYLSDASSGVEFLSTIAPHRVGSLTSFQSYSGYNELRTRILKRIDGMYIGTSRNILAEMSNDRRELSYVVSQWATSVCYDEKKYFDAKRFNTVNDYLLSLTNNPESFHRLLMDAFWHRSADTGTEEFIFKIVPQPFDAKKFAAKTRKFLKEPKLDSTIATDLQAFMTAYSLHIRKNEQTSVK